MSFEFNHFYPFLTHSFSIVFANTTMMNRKNKGATLSPYFTPTSKGTDMSIFPSISLIFLSVYILLIAEHNLGGQPYFFNISTISLWLGHLSSTQDGTCFFSWLQYRPRTWLDIFMLYYNQRKCICLLRIRLNF